MSILGLASEAYGQIHKPKRIHITISQKLYSVITFCLVITIFQTN
jgi:hypothetical protein